AQFDGSVVVERTVGEASARCHDEEANSLPLNLMHDMVTGAKSAQEAREYYAKEFLDYRRKLPTSYMMGLRFKPSDGGTADPDTRVLADHALAKAKKEGASRRYAGLSCLLYTSGKPASTFDIFRNSVAPSPRQALPCMHARVVGCSLASRSSM